MAHLTLDQAYQIAAQKFQDGVIEEAFSICEQIIRHAPKHMPTLVLLGMIDGMAGRHESALQRFKTALAINPNSTVLLFNIGETYRRWGKFAPAKRALLKALGKEMNFHPALNSLGVIARTEEGAAAAVRWFESAIKAAPGDPDVLLNLAGAFLELGKFQEAVEIYRDLDSRNIRHAPMRVQWGTALAALGRQEEAIEIFSRALDLDPSSADAHDNLATLIMETGRIDEALDHYSKAVSLSPDNASRQNNLAGCLIKSGMVDEALAAYRRALKLDPSLAEAWDALLYYLPYSSKESPASIAEEFAAWSREIGSKPGTSSMPHGVEPLAGRRLRIGYVSPDFRRHVVSQFILPFLTQHDRSGFEIFCYSAVPQPDAITMQCRDAAEHWRDISHLDDRAAAELIASDGIDILVDLAMHSRGNRLGIFSIKPAPVQCTYLATPSTTGLHTVDYRISDPHLDPWKSYDPSYSESTLHLPEIFGSYAPVGQVEVSDPPFVRNGHITFGCLNNHCKINELVLSTWSEILLSVPDSRLLIVTPSEAARRSTRDFLLGKGIDPGRLSLEGGFSLEEYLRTYNDIDIVLDPFPYQGITTTCDALWMGCPVIGLAGSRAAERMALTILTNIGHPELVADNLQDYVIKAVNLATDRDALKQHRRTLRASFLSSPVTDGKKIARNLEMLFREISAARGDSDPERGRSGIREGG